MTTTVFLARPSAPGAADYGRREDYAQVTLFTALSPCLMCSGTIVLSRMPRAIIAENQNFVGNEDVLRTRGIEVMAMNHPDRTAMMRDDIETHPEVWTEDIGE